MKRHHLLLAASVAITLSLAFGYFQFIKWKKSLAFVELPDRGSISALQNPKPIPDFSLKDERGAEVTKASLKGKIWLADFIFSSCSKSCPAMAGRMAELQRRIDNDPILREHFRLISFSVDPAKDTEQVLAEYATKHEANHEYWRFLRGGDGEVAELSQKGFSLGAMANEDFGKDPKAPEFLHSDRFVMVDQEGFVRYYFSMENDQKHIDRIVDVVKHLVKEAASSP